MGIRSRLAKALQLPPGTTTITETQAAAITPQSGTRAEPLPRDPAMGYAPFPPAMPLIPALINQPRADGRADPRRYEFPVAWNLQITEQRSVPFRTLREVADQADIIRKNIEVVKAAITGMDWDIAISDDAIARVMKEDSVGSTEAAKIVRERYQSEITRAKDFWRSPDRINGLSFSEWIGVMLEEVLVLDALSIYPNRTADNKLLHSLEILDGATIKPLLDQRGARPMAPHPAFQQILWGFPRGEFTASPEAAGEFTADDLFYAPRTRRTFSPYGFSPVERALPLVDLYLKRLHWFRTEFTDGVMPDLMMRSDMEFGNNPQLLKGYEDVFNDALAGNLEQRRRMRLLPNGFDPVFPPTYEGKYSSEFDDFLVKSICGHFGVMPSQIGFTPKHGLGGAGHQEGEANSAETLGLRPIVAWVTDTLNQLSQKFLNTPQDISFVFTLGTDDDTMAHAQRRQLEMYSGQKTWNEIRTEMGLPLFSFPEADAPLLVQSGTVTPLSASFEAFAINAMEQDNDKPDELDARVQELRDDQMKELSTFIRWAKTERARPFTFKTLNPATAETLNLLVTHDAEAARDMAAVLRKAGDARPKARREPFPANHPARKMSDRLLAIYRKLFASLGIVNADDLAEEFLSDPSDDPVAWLIDRGIVLLNLEVGEQTLTDLYLEAGLMGALAAEALIEAVRERGGTRPPTGDNTPQTAVGDNGLILEPMNWDTWKPGNPDVAFNLLGETGIGDGLQALLDNAGIMVRSIENTRLEMLGQLLGEAAGQGLGVRETAKLIESLLTNPERAEMIAHTEMTRAANAATMDQFRRDGITLVEWQTADDNACPICKDYEANNPYALADAPQPPEHPWCGCQLLPLEVGDGGDTKPIEQAVRPTLVKVRRKAIDEALARLADIPNVADGLIDVPWPIRERPEVVTEAWADSTLKLFDIETLFATQKYLKRDVVEWHLNHLGMVAVHQNSNPNVVVVDSEARIFDGHHRLAALWLLDVVAWNCWTLEV